MEVLFTDTLRKILSEASTPARVRVVEESGDSATVWEYLEASGFPDLGRAEELGGGGVSLRGLAPIAQACGEFALPVPLMETIWARAVCGDTLPPGPIALAPAARKDEHVVAPCVVLGDSAKWAMVQVAGEIRLLSMESAKPVDSAFSLVRAAVWDLQAWEAGLRPAAAASDLIAAQALLLSGQMAGSMLFVLQMTLDYANHRQQFGKPIGKFQAVQHQLSVMAEHTFAAQTAMELGFSGTGMSPDPLRVAVSKARCSSAAVEVCAASHALHGAIGFTHEFDLQLHTRRLHAWRSAAGAESYWYGIAGAEVFHGAASKSIWDHVRHLSTPEVLA